MNKKWFAVFAVIAVFSIGAARPTWAHTARTNTTQLTHTHTTNPTVAETKTAVTDHGQ